MKRIESIDNRRIKFANSLKQSKYRKQNQMFLSEGLRNVELACTNPEIIEHIFIEESKANQPRYKCILENNDIDAYLVSDKIIRSISDTVTSQGIVAICKMVDYSEYKFYLDEDVLILDRVQDPGNLGTILRTAEAAGIKTIICTIGTADIYSPKVVRSAMGSIVTLRIIFIDKIEYIERLKEEGYQIIVSSLDDAYDYSKIISIKTKIALVLGNEANGVSQDILDLSDYNVKIPIYGKAESLNVAIAGGILLYKLNERKLS